MLIWFFSIGYESHIHAWNMAWRDWLKRDFAQPIYGRVECGSLINGWFLHLLMRNSLHLFSCVNILVYLWIIWLMYLWYLYYYSVGYVYVL